MDTTGEHTVMSPAYISPLGLEVLPGKIIFFEESSSSYQGQCQSHQAICKHLSWKRVSRSYGGLKMATDFLTVFPSRDGIDWSHRLPSCLMAGWSLWPLWTINYGGCNPVPVSGPTHWKIGSFQFLSFRKCALGHRVGSFTILLEKPLGEALRQQREKEGTGWAKSSSWPPPRHVSKAVLDPPNQLPAEYHKVILVVPLRLMRSRIAQLSSAWIPVPLNCEIQWNICCFKLLGFGVVYSALRNWNSCLYHIPS